MSWGGDGVIYANYNYLAAGIMNKQKNQKIKT